MEYMNMYFQAYPGVQRYMESTRRFVDRFGFCTTFTGRRRRFAIGDYDREMKYRISRQCVNAPIQTTSSDLLSINLIDLHKVIKPLGGRILLTVHDSIVFQLPKGVTGIKEMLDDVVMHRTNERFKWLPVAWAYGCEKGSSYGEANQKFS